MESSGDRFAVAKSHPATLRALGPEGTRPFEAWWAGTPMPGKHRGLVVFDPVDRGPTQPHWVDLDTALGTRTRYRGYLEALEELRAAGRT